MRTVNSRYSLDNGTYEYLFSSVPAEQRKPSDQLILILMGFAFSVAGMTTGVQMGNAFSFLQAVGICAAGNLILFFIAMFWGMLGYCTGNTHGRLLRNLLGGKIASTFSLFLILAVVVWICINGEWFANVIMTLSPEWSIPRAVTIQLVIALIIFASIRGWKELKWISRIAVPLIVILTIVHFIRMNEISDGFAQLNAVTAESRIPAWSALIIVVGDFILSTVYMPSICRFAKNKRTVCRCALVYALMLIAGNLVGILLAKTTGAYNLCYGVYLLHLEFLSFIWLFLSIFSTQILNMYVGSLSLQNLLTNTRMGGNVSQKITVLLIGCLSMLFSSIGIGQYLSSFVRIFTMSVITLTEIAVIEILMRKNRKPVNANLPLFSWLLSMTVGALIWILTKQYNWPVIFAAAGIFYAAVRGMEKNK